MSTDINMVATPGVPSTGIDLMRTCSTCGLLSVRDEYSEKPSEASPHTRSTGYHKSSGGNTTNAKLFCHYNCQEFPLKPESHLPVNAILEGLAKTHNCQHWMVWQPGKSPKDHEDMDLLARVRAENNATLSAQREINERYHQEIMEFNKAFLEFKKDLASTISDTRAADKADAKKDREDDKEQAKQWRLEDRSLSKTSLFISAFAVIISAVATLIAAKLMTWFQS